MNVDVNEQPDKFDFVRHEQKAISEYQGVVGFYSKLAETVRGIADEAIRRRGIDVHSIQARAKNPTSFGKKAAKPSNDYPDQPMYPEPMVQITDQAAIRIITLFPCTISEIDKMLRAEFSVIEHSDKGESLAKEERFGYQSVHYLITLNPVRASLPEYELFNTTKVEVQVRTILQHAWAEIEHLIQYKSSATFPRDIKRRFMSLAGLLEIADREFEAIHDAYRDLSKRAENLILAGELHQVEITPSALKTYLDRKLGQDDRMSDFSYDWTAELLLRLGFTSLDQVDQCISIYDDDQLSRLFSRTRQGQINRFEVMLMAGMGDKYIQRHYWHEAVWFQVGTTKRLRLLAENGIQTGWFDPQPTQTS